MTSKDYRLLAMAIRAARDEFDTPMSWEVIDGVVENLCVVAQADNALFRRDVFIKACGLPPRLKGAVK